MNLAKPIRKRDPKYLEWVGSLPCAAHRPLCFDFGGVDAHHVRKEGHGGMGTKPDDSRTIPLCRRAHYQYHNEGRAWFERNYEIELETEIKRLNALYLREHPQVKERKPRETVAVHLKHCLTCARSVKRCRARNGD